MFATPVRNPADKQLIETVLANLVETNIIINRKIPKDFDSFQKLEVVEALVVCS